MTDAEKLQTIEQIQDENAYLRAENARLAEELATAREHIDIQRREIDALQAEVRTGRKPGNTAGGNGIDHRRTEMDARIERWESMKGAKR